MSAPWKGPRHSSWASNTVLSGIALGIILAVVVIVDYLNGPEPPPTYLTGLLGLAAGSFFGAVGSDKEKRKHDDSETRQTKRTETVNETAISAEVKADAVIEHLAKKHPEIYDGLPEPLKFPQPKKPK